ncbi:DUF1989 domain-containing protein [Paraferrimonas sedimenticola]|uniref:DUF1989 domain-containing protein n=1 Tax=Paraferrimonas sedimenticola TaxID=375674 RepID=A0AA37RWI4_9GAMM|nr:DUF1989 domain-containing protein [Paraferrimonas sedimenticola]GLP96224.1 hypothetical protein GCM10007895_15300 [Paraferrimonas sedimenticola]
MCKSCASKPLPSDAPNFSEALDYDLSKTWRQTDAYKKNVEVVDKVCASSKDWKFVYEQTLEPHTGDAYLVKKGQVIRMEHLHDRAQVVDWHFITPDLKERSSMGNSVCWDGFYLKKYYQVMSNAGEMKPLVTMVRDDTTDEFGPEGYGNHIWIYHCSPEWQNMFYPDAGPEINSCHMNFVQGFHRVPAIAAIEDEQERKDFVNVLASDHNFQTFQIMDIYYKPEEKQSKIMLGVCGDVKKGDALEFYANEDVYVVVSSCPYGDFTSPVFGDKAKLPDPLKFTVWDTGIQPPEAPEWKDWSGAFYDMVESGHKDISPRTEESLRTVPTSGPNGTELWLNTEK